MCQILTEASIDAVLHVDDFEPMPVVATLHLNDQEIVWSVRELLTARLGVPLAIQHLAVHGDHGFMTMRTIAQMYPTVWAEMQKMVLAHTLMLEANDPTLTRARLNDTVRVSNRLHLLVRARLCAGAVTRAMTDASDAALRAYIVSRWGHYTIRPNQQTLDDLEHFLPGAADYESYLAEQEEAEMEQWTMEKADRERRELEREDPDVLLSPKDRASDRPSTGR